MSNSSSFRASSAGFPKGSSSEQHAPLSACSCSFSLFQMMYQRIGIYFTIATSLVTLSSEPESQQKTSLQLFDIRFASMTLYVFDKTVSPSQILVANFCSSFGWTHVQSTSRITTLGGASKKCPYSRSVVMPEVSLYVLQLEGTLLWAGKCCRYSRIVVISAVVISEVDCTWSLT